MRRSEALACTMRSRSLVVRWITPDTFSVATRCGAIQTQTTQLRDQNQKGVGGIQQTERQLRSGMVHRAALHECHEALACDSRTFSDADVLQAGEQLSHGQQALVGHSVAPRHVHATHGRVGLQRSLPVVLGVGLLPVHRRGAWGDKDPVVDAIAGGEVEFTEVGEAEEGPHAGRVEHAFRRSKLRGEVGKSIL